MRTGFRIAEDDALLTDPDCSQLWCPPKKNAATSIAAFIQEVTKTGTSWRTRQRCRRRNGRTPINDTRSTYRATSGAGKDTHSIHKDTRKEIRIRSLGL